MNHNTMLYNYAKRTRNFWGVIILIFLLAFYVLGDIFNKTIIIFYVHDYNQLVATRLVDYPPSHIQSVLMQ